MNSRAKGKTKDLERAATDRFVALVVILFVGLFLLDAFVIHSIPAPEGTFRVTDGADWEFDLYKRDVPYSDSKCLGSSATDSRNRIYLVQAGEEVHLLVFDTHFATLRTGMIGDIEIDPNVNKTYRIPALLGSYRVTISNGRLRRTEWHGIYRNRSMINRPEIVAYFLTALVLAVVDNILYRKIWKWRKRKHDPLREESGGTMG